MSNGITFKPTIRRSFKSLAVIALGPENKKLTMAARRLEMGGLFLARPTVEQVAKAARSLPLAEVPLRGLDQQMFSAQAYEAGVLRETHMARLRRELDYARPAGTVTKAQILRMINKAKSRRGEQPRSFSIFQNRSSPARLNPEQILKDVFEEVGAGLLRFKRPFGRTIDLRVFDRKLGAAFHELAKNRAQELRDMAEQGEEDWALEIGRPRDVLGELFSAKRFASVFRTPYGDPLTIKGLDGIAEEAMDRLASLRADLAWFGELAQNNPVSEGRRKEFEQNFRLAVVLQRWMGEDFPWQKVVGDKDVTRFFVRQERLQASRPRGSMLEMLRLTGNLSPVALFLYSHDREGGMRLNLSGRLIRNVSLDPGEILVLNERMARKLLSGAREFFAHYEMADIESVLERLLPEEEGVVPDQALLRELQGLLAGQASGLDLVQDLLITAERTNPLQGIALAHAQLESVTFASETVGEKSTGEKRLSPMLEGLSRPDWVRPRT